MPVERTNKLIHCFPQVRDELEHLLDDDNDMAEMYLTEKLAESSREQTSLREESGIVEVQVDDQR